METAAAWGIVSGYPDGTFQPNQAVTRRQLAKIVVAAMGRPLETRGAPHFSNVLAGSIYYHYVETAYANGLIGGYADGTFISDASGTRAQVTKVIATVVNS